MHDMHAMLLNFSGYYGNNRGISKHTVCSFLSISEHACISTNNKVESKLNTLIGTSLYLCRQLQNKMPEIE